MIQTDLKPPRPSRQTKRSFLVLCENEDQSAYLEWLKTEFGHPLLTIRKLPFGTSPQDAVAHAVRLRRSEKIKGTHFDETWCMLSLKDQQTLEVSLELARSSGVHLAVTVGDFSNWLRLHWSTDEPTPPILVGETSPAGFAAALHDRIEVAMRRAGANREITTVDLLVKALVESSKAFERRELDSPQRARDGTGRGTPDTDLPPG